MNRRSLRTGGEANVPGEPVDRSITLAKYTTSGWSRWRQRNWRPAHWCGDKQDIWRIQASAGALQAGRAEWAIFYGLSTMRRLNRTGRQADCWLKKNSGGHPFLSLRDPVRCSGGRVYYAPSAWRAYREKAPVSAAVADEENKKAYHSVEGCIRKYEVYFKLTATGMRGEACGLQVVGHRLAPAALSGAM